MKKITKPRNSNCKLFSLLIFCTLYELNTPLMIIYSSYQDDLSTLWYSVPMSHPSSCHFISKELIYHFIITLLLLIPKSHIMNFIYFYEVLTNLWIAPLLKPPWIIWTYPLFLPVLWMIHCSLSMSDIRDLFFMLSLTHQKIFVKN